MGPVSELDMASTKKPRNNIDVLYSKNRTYATLLPLTCYEIATNSTCCNYEILSRINNEIFFSIFYKCLFLLTYRIIQWTATSGSIGATPACHSSVPSALCHSLSRCSKGFGDQTRIFITGNIPMSTL